MSSKRRVKGWWVICLMAGLGAQPLCAAEAGAVSRAVEVAPPKGWTPDTPLFQDEPAAPSPGPAVAAPREAGGSASNSARAVHRLDSASVDAGASVRRTRGPKLAERSAATKREAQAKAAAPSREVDRRARAATGKGTSLKEARLAKAKGAKAAANTPKAPTRRVAAQQPAVTVARSGKAGKVEAHARRSGNNQARQATQARHAGREPVLAQRSAKRAPPGAQAGGRAGSAGVKKG